MKVIVSKHENYWKKISQCFKATNILTLKN